MERSDENEATSSDVDYLNNYDDDMPRKKLIKDKNLSSPLLSPKTTAAKKSRTHRKKHSTGSAKFDVFHNQRTSLIHHEPLSPLSPAQLRFEQSGHFTDLESSDDSFASSKYGTSTHKAGSMIATAGFNSPMPKRMKKKGYHYQT